MNLDTLNAAQRQAVLHTEGPLLVLAGAGSGKTRVLTHRFAYLVRSAGVAPEQICAVTFTNKAAGEMRERVRQLLKIQSVPWLATFHSLCARLLRRHADRLSLPRDFAIYDDTDQLAVMRRAAGDLNLSEQLFPPAQLLHAVDRAKNDAWSPDDLLQRAADSFNQRVAQAYQRYQQLLAANAALDFGDLLLRTLELFRNHPEVLELYRQRLRYLMVDEFQDTNRAQYLLVRQLAAAHNNACVVGDDDQSIYRWRGADIRNILDFERDFPTARVIRLEQNYRSTQTILDAAGAVITNNRGRKGKTLWTENGAGSPVTLFSAADERGEARFVCDEIGQLRRRGHALGDVAVFYRTNAQSRALEDELARAGLPYAMVGGMRFYERKEVKDLLAYLRVLANPRDAVSLLRIINTPSRGIGATTVEALTNAAKAQDRPLFEVILDPTTAAGLSTAAATRVAAFAATMRQLREIDRGAVTPLLRRVIDDTGYLDRLQAEATPEAESRADNVRELLTVTEQFDAQSTETGLTAFLEQMALVTDLDGFNAAPDRVTLMTLHNSKGLEFPVVFIIGAEEGLFPHERSLESPDAIEEERRLCYVGMTRARRCLYLLHASERHLFGRTHHNSPSRFLTEIPARLLEQRSERRSEFAAPGDEPTIDYSYSQLTGAATRTSRRPLPPRPSAANGLRLGMRVRHQEFGVGVIRRIEGSGDQCKLTVLFERGGSRKLLQRFAQLEMLS
ncbi:MAG: UvrD-helicase domain-containing protein [Deltaproteobacteria bacterium]|nr:UvrD-helicase domain-containing protein [Deltaproteobacteria bacterium]